MMNLKDYAKELNTGLEIMTGRESKPLSDMAGQVLKLSTIDTMTINEDRQDKDVVVLTFVGIPEFYFYGPSATVDRLLALEKMAKEMKLEVLDNENVEIEVMSRKSKQGRQYTDIKFI